MQDFGTGGSVPGAVTLAEARGWLRLGADGDDAVVAGLIGAASQMCEAFIGRWLIERAAEEIWRDARAALWLSARPVAGVDLVALRLPDGGEQLLDAADYRREMESDGRARLTLAPDVAGVAAGRGVRVGYRAGMAAEPGALPEAIRHGVLRLIRHMHEARDGDAGAPPAAIAALWQPWRRMALSCAGRAPTGCAR
ncbi:head-tail connector protein [Sphingopyxis sp. MWB1]|uniref:head-tail connector protein n=1 Tax=Sphingopyxis sp. MWB1 TaxID=1537715 RepID=UPI00068C891C|nr:phage head-tail connector protein [Sphingopyxis sp. MWB1]